MLEGVEKIHCHWQPSQFLLFSIYDEVLVTPTQVPMMTTPFHFLERDLIERFLAPNDCMRGSTLKLQDMSVCWLLWKSCFLRIGDLIGSGRTSVNHARNVGAIYDSDLVSLLGLKKRSPGICVNFTSTAVLPPHSGDSWLPHQDPLESEGSMHGRLKLVLPYPVRWPRYLCLWRNLLTMPQLL